MATKEKVVETLKTVLDPHLGVDIYSLGLIYKIEIEGDTVKIEMTLTNPGCPMAKAIIGDAKSKVEKMEGVKTAEISLVFDPPWNMNMLSDELKKRWNIPSN